GAIVVPAPVRPSPELELVFILRAGAEAIVVVGLGAVETVPVVVAPWLAGHPLPARRRIEDAVRLESTQAEVAVDRLGKIGGDEVILRERGESGEMTVLSLVHSRRRLIIRGGPGDARGPCHRLVVVPVIRVQDRDRVSGA